MPRLNHKNIQLTYNSCKGVDYNMLSNHIARKCSENVKDVYVRIHHEGSQLQMLIISPKEQRLRNPLSHFALSGGPQLEAVTGISNSDARKICAKPDSVFQSAPTHPFQCALCQNASFKKISERKRHQNMNTCNRAKKSPKPSNQMYIECSEPLSQLQNKENKEESHVFKYKESRKI